MKKNNRVMSEFQEIPANKASISGRKLVFGHGINDANYITWLRTNGKRLYCPYYQKWHSMINRCYGKKFHKAQPTYKDCTVSKEWLSFSNFKLWMIKQDWKGKCLDKDILKPGNKHYSPETCVFVTDKLNLLLVDRKTKRSGLPRGIYFDKRKNKFVAGCSEANGKVRYLGSFLSQSKASQMYNEFKSSVIIEVANQQTDEKIKNGLLLHADEYMTQKQHEKQANWIRGTK